MNRTFFLYLSFHLNACQYNIHILQKVDAVLPVPCQSMHSSQPDFMLKPGTFDVVLCIDMQEKAYVKEILILLQLYCLSYLKMVLTE